MGNTSKEERIQKVIDEEQAHYNYFDCINNYIEKLGDTYLAKIAGTPSSTGLGPSGFAVSEEN